MVNMLCIFTYDVSVNRNRRRVARLLEEKATRVQLSVFEARLSKSRADALAQRVAAELGPGGSLRVYAVGENGLKRKSAGINSLAMGKRAVSRQDCLT